MVNEALTVRPVGPEEYAKIVEIAGRLEDQPLDVSVLNDRDRQEAQVCLRLVAEERGEPVGYGLVERFAYVEEGVFSVAVAVDRSRERRGIGTELLKAAEAIAARANATVLNASVREEDVAAVAFAVNRGYRRTYHLFSSELDLATFDVERFRPALDRVEAAGIRFESFAETDGSEAAMRRLFEINERGSGHEPGGDRPFAQFRRDVFEAGWFRPAGQILAVADGEYVGIAAVGEVAKGHFYHMNTAVLPSFRGRGVATALKLRVIAAAQRMGGRVVATHNDSANAPMLAINRKLGYVARPGRFGMRKRLSAAPGAINDEP
jgi:GNAT superfamily N-acetyltransferase